MKTRTLLAAFSLTTISTLAACEPTSMGFVPSYSPIQPAMVVTGSTGGGSQMVERSPESLCQEVGARLPTRAEFEQLAKSQGLGTAQGYSPFLNDGQTEVLPGLATGCFLFANDNSNECFDGEFGVFESHSADHILCTRQQESQ